MKKYISAVFFGALLCISSVAVAIMPFYVDQQLRNTNYSNFMRQYPNPEYQIITPNNLINMDWLKGAAAAVYNDGYTNDNDTAMALWRHMTNAVNFVAERSANPAEMKARLWGALTRSLEELRRQRAQRQQAQPVYTPSTPAAPTVSAPTRALPIAPTVTTSPAMSLDKEGILNGALGSAYAAKLGEILNYKTRTIGLISLASAISTDIENINEDNTPRATKITDLKRRIDKIYDMMLKRRAEGK